MAVLGIALGLIGLWLWRRSRTPWADLDCPNGPPVSSFSSPDARPEHAPP